ncbi:hypothetical protein GGI19_003998 [Coemansia pectinata]|uniref:Uncharacterized protein n=1 Tax=Coemansia pectinata TaxID=1052879 RepID=A0A9W8GTD3_9FUNG|nr:hypothetical protein GGI19_003998 [Coemansia pectinata]
MDIPDPGAPLAQIQLARLRVCELLEKTKLELRGLIEARDRLDAVEATIAKTLGLPTVDNVPVSPPTAGGGAAADTSAPADIVTFATPASADSPTVPVITAQITTSEPVVASQQVN